MINRYTITASAEKIADRFSVELPEFHQPKYNAAPTDLLPVIRLTDPQGVSRFFWGTSPEWSKNRALSEKIINVQAEVIPEKPALKKAMMRTRCIVPADSFYAWKKVGKKSLIPYRFVATNQELFSFAGLWEEFEDTNGEELHTFTIITVAANSLVSSIYERMPVMLDPATEKVWLNKESTEDDLLNVLKPYADSKMNLYSISPRIIDSKTDVPSLILPTPPSDQFGNLTLFD